MNITKKTVYGPNISYRAIWIISQTNTHIFIPNSFQIHSMNQALIKILQNPELREELLCLNLIHPDKLEFSHHYLQYIHTEIITDWLWQFIQLFFPECQSLLLEYEEGSDARWFIMRDIQQRINEDIIEKGVKDFLCENIMRIKTQKKRRHAIDGESLNPKWLRRWRKNSEYKKTIS